MASTSRDPQEQRVHDASGHGALPARRLLPKSDWRELLAIFVGGCVGALARAGLAHGLPHRTCSWPWATFWVNIVGAFLLGYFATRLQERLPFLPYWRPLLGTGLCGALTTFSTLQVELLDLLRAGHAALAVGYAAASIAGGFLAIGVATVLVRRVRVLA